MLYPSFLTAGAFALTANAFLIPGNLESFPSITNKEVLHPAVSPDQQGQQHVTLDCSSCPYALNGERNGVHEWISGVASDLEMTVDSQDGALRLNEVPFYPIQTAGLPPALHVSQQKKADEASTAEAYQGDLRLSYSVEFNEQKADDSSSLITITMSVLALDGEMVKVDDLEIKAIKDVSGQMILLSATSVTPSPDAPDAKCTNVLCRVFSKILNNVNMAKAAATTAGQRVKCFCVKCFQRLAGKHIPHLQDGPGAHRRPDGTLELPTHLKFRPHHMHGHRQGGFLHRLVHIMWATVKLAFVPILIGVAFGMAASAIGMLVGQLVVFLWLKYRKDQHVIYEPVASDEKDGLPAYEDVPAAEVKDEKEVEAKV